MKIENKMRKYQICIQSIQMNVSPPFLLLSNVHYLCNVESIYCAEPF